MMYSDVKSESDRKVGSAEKFRMKKPPKGGFL